ncbi:M1 family metallopeptidase [Spirosoma pollinicola]|uniref:Aminopeptidase N n=1 Tax=Spirosoma pollinicola TaxID=2057025 RepID=A0A2K8YY15_9BACT|nr:M1 family aminopeptidase [Spirosoma pollinicola]AUD02474.1 aminopeptidase [Spirosoma pollinicola]
MVWNFPKITRYGATLFVLSLLVMSCNRRPLPSQSSLVETGVLQTLANARKQTISQLAYVLKFDIPAQKNQPILSTETISFNWAAPRPAQPTLELDFKEERAHLQTVSVNGTNIPIAYESEHLLISTAFLKSGANTVSIQFTAGNLSLNRNDEYLYTLLVPDRTRTVFPCFDQPDLKATFQVSLTIPASWQAMTNAPLRDSTLSGDRKTMNFLPSDRIPTYLFSFVAGKFTPVTRTPTGRSMTLLHRETDSTKLRLSTDLLFSLHADALRFLEEFTQIPYPFQKFDFVAIPDFQYGGMEHVGAIDYRSSALFLDNGATRDQRLSRAHVIAHETAHMWFGDLVTMRWFDDVWLKEVFANFIADKIMEVSSADANYDLQFVVDHFPAAYAVDRTEGANPIGQPLANLQEAGSLYGGIIYHKAPIMMRQLERLMGKTALRDGLREYLKKYAFSNATWAELIAILDARTPANLTAWNHVWVNETGRPKFTYQLDGKGGKIKQFIITQQGEDGSNRLWPQHFDITLVYADHTEELDVNMNQAQVTLTESIGKPTPQYMIFNSSGQGYGVFPIDSVSVLQLERIKNPVARASIYINLYENMVAGQSISPASLVTGYRSLLGKEPEELNLRLLTSQLSDIVWTLTKPEARPALATAVEEDAWRAMEQETASGKKKLLFRLYQNIALSQTARDRLYTIWNDQKAPAGVTLTEDDYTALALALAVRDYPAEGILTKQLARIKNPDRRKRLEFMMPALSSSVMERDAFFASLASDTNREHEAWVTAALGYLHHPLRTETSAKYLPKSLDLLEEIQRTGDIFFPESWLRATLSTYQTPETAQLVRKFLADRPTYNARLRAKLLQAADGPFRASKLLY